MAMNSISLRTHCESTVQPPQNQNISEHIKTYPNPKNRTIWPAYIKTLYIYGSVSKPCTPSVHIKIAGIDGCSSP